MNLFDFSTNSSEGALDSQTRQTFKIQEQDVKMLAAWLGGNPVYTHLFRGTRDGFSSSTFHSKCDGQGATLILILSDKGKVFGGFTSIPLSS